MYEKFKKQIFNLKTDEQFDDLALEIFRFQAENNLVYKKYIEYLKINISKVNSIYKIPFLPIQFFKSKKIITKFQNIEETKFTLFLSSGTTQTQRSRHYVCDLEIYEKSFIQGFEHFYGNIEDKIFLGLLPSYLEAGNSSLVYMLRKLIELSKSEYSGFYLHDYDKLYALLKKLKHQQKKIILFGVSYALLDIAKYVKKEKFENLIIIETGGMKGRKKELTREELHLILEKSLGTEHVHSEYGMTELLSQAYMNETGLFYPAQTMKVLIRDINDPFHYVRENKTGGINIIDLSNLLSCSFVETKDLGRQIKKGFEVLGRFDNSDIRGCNLLIT